MRHEDQPFWRTTWNGDAVEGGEYDERTPTLTDSPGKTARAMVWGVSVPWTLVLSAVLGFWQPYIV